MSADAPGVVLVSGLGVLLFGLWLASAGVAWVRRRRAAAADAAVDRAIAAATDGARAGKPRWADFGAVACSVDALRRVHVVCAQAPGAACGVHALVPRGDTLALTVPPARVAAARRWVAFAHGLPAPAHN